MTRPATRTDPEAGKPNRTKQQDDPQAQAAQGEGGGGAPGTGASGDEPTPEVVKKIADSEAQQDEPDPPGDDG